MLSTQNNQYHTLDELNGSESDGYVTFGSVSDHIQQSSSYNSEDEIASKKVGATIFNDEESMSIALKKAQILVDQEEKEDESEIDEETRVEILESKGKSAVVIIGEEIIVDYSGCCINKKWASKQTMDLAQKQSLLYQKYYLGPRSDVKAKDACSIRSSWHLYHRIEKSLSDAAASLSDTFQLPSTLHLYIIYRRNDNGQHE
uniref:Uncharacterized protein n=1 Tax=Panagrolaimus superbus TaxID=310955 RepID=A0A914Z292_9BILA